MREKNGGGPSKEGGKEEGRRKGSVPLIAQGSAGQITLLEAFEKLEPEEQQEILDLVAQMMGKKP